MKPAGIVAPTDLEARLLIERLQGRTSFLIQGKDFNAGGLGALGGVVIAVSGIGKANAAQTAALLVDRFTPRAVYVVGVAGAYPSSGLAVGDVAVAEREVFGDEGLLLDNDFCTLETIGLPVLKLCGRNYYNEFPMHVPEEWAVASVRGTFVTVSACTGTLRRARDLKRRFGAVCENMEGAAVAQVCTACNVPVAELRAVSNVITERQAVGLDRADLQQAAERAQRVFFGTLADL